MTETKKTIGGEYKVLKQFGGAMGHVFLVEKEGISFPFVLKSYQDIKPHLEELFFTEAKNWTSFGVHQNIVKTLFAEKIEGRIFVAAEFVEPNDNNENRLTSYIGKDVPLALIIKWAIQFTYGMNHCVGKGMIAHSDIKPDNILIDRELNLKITDFGLSKSILNDDRIGGGTPLYYSPEQIFQPDRIDHRSDIYSFGIVLYQLITKGNYPYVMSSPDIRQVHLKEPVKSINHPLFEICKKCMEKDLSKRYQQFQELFKDLVSVAKENSIDIPKQTITKDDKLEELYILSRSLSAIGNKNGALQAINEYLRHQPDHFTAWSQKGRLEYELGQLQNALESTKKSVFLYQYNPTALNNLGIIYLEQDNNKDAKTCLLRAVELDPNNSGALMNLANTLVETGDISESAQCILRCFELTPEKLSLHINAKNLLPKFVQNQLFEFASRIYTKLADYSDLTINESFNAAMCCYQVHDFKNAIKFFKVVLSNNENDGETIINLSKSYFFIGDISNAIKYAEFLIDKQINPAQGMSMKAQYLHQSGLFNEAVSYLDNILKKYPMTDYLWLTLGDIYKKEGQTDEALNCYLKTRQIKIQKGANMNDKDIQFIDNKIRETKQNAT
ncbi:tetratricopeptide repeat protein [Pedobacter sp. BS3]|uniref:serine/threonine-protein kinase n=1 Tax=Pedobacter sp. BS3 TaxID=2567937 RepID=UPI0011EC18D1|nr:serine/threonine-protein kinase [Pedobacter sp. BS3]TZF83899.1 tetratricopeptide repeat protein [Pedobacter sp. BS3]